MKRTLFFFSIFMGFAIALQASPTPKPRHKRTSHKTQAKSEGPATSEEIALSANGWFYVKGEWVHPDGYKYLNGKILRTTARAGRTAPNPPGKLALENAAKLTPKVDPESAKTAAEKKAEIRRKNLEPRPAPQTGTHL